ncbi:MAG TPA: cystathionine beta-lyase [Quisquiliibacterium sp.]|nr:cystathionine beta-lyase [Quisquiliibacterium sp.]
MKTEDTDTTSRHAAPGGGNPDAGPAPAFASLVTEVARRFDERIVTASLPVYRASTVLFDSLAQADAAGRATGAGARHASTYGTAGTPTTFALMDALAEVEGRGHACRAALMPSGLSAITTALFAYAKTGDHVLMPDSVYGPARAFAQGMLAGLGVQTTFYDPRVGAGIEALIRPNTRVVYLESPGSYTFEVQDVPAICEVARRHGAVSMIDNAWASPVFARPFDWGVDVSILPLTKYWSGHADTLMGAVVVREPLWQALWDAERQLGICVGGDDAFMILRGLRTVDVRMRRHEASGLQVARWLEQRPEVARVLHPALESHPDHALWKRDFDGACGLFSFELRRDALPADAAGLERAMAALCERRRFFRIGYSWGGFESLIVPGRIASIRTARPWTGGPLVRLHIGLEDPADLIADLEAGLAAMRAVA